VAVSVQKAMQIHRDVSCISSCEGRLPTPLVYICYD